MSQPTGDHFQISVGGAVGGNLVVGTGNQVIGSPTTHFARPSAAEIAAFTGAVEAVKAQLPPPTGALGAEAAAELDKLHAAVVAPTPDLSTMQRVRTWFVEHLPTMAGAVTGLLIHPVVGALVKSAGDAVTAEFHRRFASSEGPIAPPE
jgi:hypothetical protein